MSGACRWQWKRYDEPSVDTELEGGRRRLTVLKLQASSVRVVEVSFGAGGHPKKGSRLLGCLCA